MLGTQNNTNYSGYDIINMLYGNNGTGGSNIDPQVIQSLLTTQMTANF